jgi:cysteine desulfurase
MWGKKRVYLDTAAGIAANPSSPHEEGRQARLELEDARTAIARLVEAQADDVIFTSGATESNAIAILGAVRAHGAAKKHVLYLPSSHASIVENVKLLQKEGVAAEELPIRDYRVDTDALAKMLRPETVLVAMDAVCGETGVVWNTREVRQVLAKSRPHGTVPILLHVDASQAPLVEKITRDHFGADLLSLDAAKVGTVRGIGALIAHRTIALAPLYAGGGQERGVRPGTEAPELARAFAAALARAAYDREAFCASASELRSTLIERIIGGVQDVYIQEGRDQAPHILNLSLPGRDTDYLVALLDEAGYAVSTRSACETDSEEGSRAVLALTGDRERARATLRISWNHATKSSAVLRAADALLEAIEFVDSARQR